MPRHRTPEEKRELGEQARVLRAAGRSRREIVRELHIGEELLTKLLDGTPVPASLRRRNAKDGVRAQAVELRLAGKSYDEISKELGVSKSSCSLWLRDLPRPEDNPDRRAAAEARRLDGLRARMRRDREDRDKARQSVTQLAGQGLGAVTARDLVLALAVSYWCEGAKRKPWNRAEVVQWMNSDPMLVRLFLEGLRLIGIGEDRFVLRVHIHESADEEAARRWWSNHTGIPLDQFRRSTIKRHNPKTVRRNVNEEYRGCLCIVVLQSRLLYQVLEGLVDGLARQPRELDGLARQPRELDGWHDDAGAQVERQSDRELPSALV